MAFNLVYKRFGACSILVEWPAVIEEEILKDIMIFKTAIEKNNIKTIVELKHAYNSLLISYSSFLESFKNESDRLKNLYKSLNFKNDTVSVLWRIPVCYDAVFGIDLETISVEKKLSKDMIIKRHSESIYTVYFIGFLPGFLYLGGLDESLYMARKTTPRLQIEKGAVAIGGNQTGVYPMSSPGGWHVIGNSPIAFFNPKLKSPCFAKAEDRIVFEPISLKEYHNIKVLVEAGVFQLKSEVFHG
ncbi:5-oxoprolinase subunit PxpB [Mariniflexile litorale]|uniref:5-oxoprolinase subunit PxpB n=1 Tax=Mariniflexile litorale TaxID=3045158 RepID=A0AAU7EGR9_9FLAO|nr:5-oxoprolinase subunit PxpB [Mariniflexile sp. KMM 9835]MDQ8211855.1 5-oxoprolinase subunit PxpB [Mariniflexile sp. KMM 9835]